MEVVFAAICQRIDRPEGELPSLIGLIDGAECATLPQELSYQVYVDLAAKPEEAGTIFELGARFVPPGWADERADLKEVDWIVPAGDPPGTPPRFTYDLNLQLTIRHFGLHEVQILLNGEVAGRLPFAVREGV